MTKVSGRSLISAKVIATSIGSVYKTRLTTFELEYPRFIHSEFMTHRMLSKNSASSRAIPIEKMHAHIMDFPQEPVEWGKNQSGMQAKELLPESVAKQVQETWDHARLAAIEYSKRMAFFGVHKQIANRITEPFMQMKVVVSGTEWDNFFWLRDHADAQPEIRELASCMRAAYVNSEKDIQILAPGEWHVPYIETKWSDDGLGSRVYLLDGKEIDVKDAIMVSASCCAQVSYRKNDDSLEKAKMIYDRLIHSEPVHASPVEHQATPITVVSEKKPFEQAGTTHRTKNGDLWSGNFRHWIQHRQLISNHAKMEI